MFGLRLGRAGSRLAPRLGRAGPPLAPRRHAKHHVSLREQIVAGVLRKQAMKVRALKNQALGDQALKDLTQDLVKSHHRAADAMTAMSRSVQDLAIAQDRAASKIGNEIGDVSNEIFSATAVVIGLTAVVIAAGAFLAD